ncbi:polyribonucleotide nucleotidyltransferase [bacterium DOLZORAL124_64_63]|nr:MAG: polyribonucleotide nucleotidyltransferase [bacterium DOLZORAL124_64_63]
MTKHVVSMEMNGTTFSLETGRMAKQANGSCIVRMGDTMSLMTVTADKNPSDRDFLPLFVEYRNKTYAAGKIPGGFFKREARPTERETLSCRLIDRPLRPMFPKGYRHETQIVAFVISADTDFHADTLSITGASMALNLSDVPFTTLVSGVRVAEVDGEFIPNPSFDQLEESSMDLVVAGTDDIVCMIEGECLEVSEDRLLDAIEFAHVWIKKLNNLQRELIEKAGAKTKWEFVEPVENTELIDKVETFVGAKLREAIVVKGKMERAEALSAVKDAVKAEFTTEDGDADPEALEALGKVEKKTMREMILSEGTRTDGRDLKTVRPITVECGVLPRAHGSCLFTRGETQSLGTATLGSKQAEQRIEPLNSDQYWSKYYLHYNFPPFSVGEVGRYSGTGRREIGHGKLAERAIRPILPDLDDFPYTIRLVSDILESNGSSSMATVCSCCLAMMDAGAPLKAPVAGVAMGLIKEDDRVAVLTDILGVEDHLGDMDFKVTGTREGITAFQLDTKIAGISREIMTEALTDAKNARNHILDVMQEALPESRTEMSPYAPKIETIQIPVKKIGQLIGPGGKVIKKIQEDTGATIEVDDDGLVFISSIDQAGGEAAMKFVEGLMAEPEVGKVYKGVVKTIVDFGAFVEYLPGKDGLLHISELEHFRVGNVEDVLQLGDEVEVKLVEVDSRTGKVRLSRKALLPVPEGMENMPQDDGGRRDGGRRDGGRGGDRRGGRGGRGGRR